MRIYGPVPSRRFGLSLGVDVIPHKTCSFDCIYCQLGETDCLTARPADFFTIEEIMDDVREALEDGPSPDVITLAGSGDPTLYGPLPELIRALKDEVDAPVLLITNAAMLWHPKVAEAALAADILAPSLDAGYPETYQRVNRPHPDITFDLLVKGLRDVTLAHKGEVRLEIMLIKDVNDSEESMRAIAAIVEGIRCDRIDLNTPVRPPVPERGALPCDDDVLELAQTIFGPKAVPIGSFVKKRDVKPSKTRSFSDRDKDVRGMLMRRPCTKDDIIASLGLEQTLVTNILKRLEDAGLVESRQGGEGTYYHSLSDNPTLQKK